MKRKTLKRSIEEFILATPGAEDWGNRTVARAFVEAYPALLMTVEQARDLVRDIRGNHGAANARYATMPRPNGVAGEYKRTMPKSRTIQREPFFLPAGVCLVLPDIHVPYHDEEAVQIAIEYGQSRGANVVLLNGDFLDCHRISRFTSEPEAISFKEEVFIGRQMLEYIRGEFPDAQIVYKIGNHEERLEQYMYQRAPDVADLSCWKIGSLLGLDDLGIELVEDKRVIMAAQLAIFHGHELNKGLATPVNPARGAYLKASCHSLVGHHHKTSEHCETSALGDMTSCCLFRVRSDRTPRIRNKPVKIVHRLDSWGRRPPEENRTRSEKRFYIVRNVSEALPYYMCDS